MSEDRDLMIRAWEIIVGDLGRVLVRLFLIGPIGLGTFAVWLHSTSSGNSATSAIVTYLAAMSSIPTVVVGILLLVAMGTCNTWSNYDYINGIRPWWGLDRARAQVQNEKIAQEQGWV
ncbi:MAG TPA: hypothetical protein VJ742_12725 [Nitrososphaera sp.]|nr:hypothetical protein [Nitrososphaera sp.]